MDKVAIYTRLSKEDYDKISSGDDSESIQNQKMLLIDYATSHDMQIDKVYTDDDFTGSDLTRPGWNQMLIDAENGCFNIILCKTQSRFARSSATIENYINGVFIEWGIRFISIVDNIDTNIKSTKKASQIHGLVDQWYLEDLSDNIKTVFQKKMRDGQFLGSFTCYGYKRNPNNRHKIIIDEEAAEVVRLIFNLNLQGYGVDTISQKLTEMEILTPTMYKQKQGLNFKNPNVNYTKNGIWSTTTLKRILNNEAYIGTLIQGREKKVSYKSKKVVIAPKDEWIIIKNNHEPIISEEIFHKTQQLLQIRRKTCKTTGGKKFVPHLFSGKIKCLDCNSTMAKTSGRLAGGHDYFICQLAKKTKLNECTRHSIRYDDLVSHVEERLREKIEHYSKNKDEYISEHLKKSDLNKALASCKNKLSKCKSKLDDINKTLSSMYMDKVKGLLSEDDFINIKSTLITDLDGLRIDEEKLLKEEKDIQMKLKSADSSVNYLEKYKDFVELTQEIVNNVIICIWIGEKSEDPNVKRKIKIKWNA
jgi:DNA invertase Pin-like site-specific DNA recombinase